MLNYSQFIKLRKEKGLTQHDVAGIFSVTYGAVGMWETGKRSPSLETIAAMAKYFKVPIQSLLTVSIYTSEDDSVQAIIEPNIENNNIVGQTITVRDSGKMPISTIEIDEPVKIPVYASVCAGEGVEIQLSDIIDYLEISPTLLKSGKIHCLLVDGDSMIGEGIYPGSYLIMREQPDVDSGQIAIVCFDNEKCKVRKIKKTGNSIQLIPANDKYDIESFSGEKLNSLRIIGKVVQTVRNYD